MSILNFKRTEFILKRKKRKYKKIKKEIEERTFKHMMKRIRESQKRKKGEVSTGGLH